MRRSAVLLAAVMSPLVCAPASAHARKEALAAFYTLQMAPRVCHWRHLDNAAKLATEILAQERDLRITASEKAALMRQAEADLRSDPAICAPGGTLRPVYDRAIR